MLASFLIQFGVFGAVIDDPRGEGVVGKDYDVFEISHLRCVIGNNKSTQGGHLAGYNGVFSLTTPDDSENVFVPAYAGLNLEHYFDRTPRNEQKEIFFEPRYSPMIFRRLSPTSCELYQPPTPTYKVQSWTVFTLKEPYYVDLEFRCIPHEKTFVGDFLGVFWASYIHSPEDKSIYFLRSGSSLDNPKWQQFCTQYHNHFSTVLSDQDKGPTDFSDMPPVLWNQISPLRYSVPFFYGRVRDKVLIYIFEENPYLRFAHSPSGGGESKDRTDTNPAWDFQMVIPNYVMGNVYRLKMRLVYKAWKGREDVLLEVKKFYSDLEEGNE